MNKIFVLGVGPGSPDYLSPAIVEQAAKCDLLIGGKRNLELFDFPGQEKLEIKKDLKPLMAIIKDRLTDQKVGILVSGDTGIYSMLPRLAREFGRQALLVYPGISAVQYIFARLGLTWHDARIVSLHGREFADLAAIISASEKVALFTDLKNTPALVCRKLFEAGIKDKKVYIGENLSYPSEKITEGYPVDFLDFNGSDLNLVVINGE